jgi:hypothetical protein
MEQKSYRRRKGDLEIRVLRDGRLVVAAPDAALLEIARTMYPNDKRLTQRVEKRKHGRTRKIARKPGTK